MEYYYWIVSRSATLRGKITTFIQNLPYGSRGKAWEQRSNLDVVILRYPADRVGAGGVFSNDESNNNYLLRTYAEVFEPTVGWLAFSDWLNYVTNIPEGW